MARKAGWFLRRRYLWAACLFSLSVSTPSYVHAATIFSEDYEVADMTALQAKGWNLTCSSSPCTTDLVTSPVHGGTKALRQTYVGEHCPGGNCSIGDATNSKITKTFTNTPEIYERYYLRYDQIDPNQPSDFGSVGGKQHYINVSILPNFYFITWNDFRFMTVNQTTASHLCPNGNMDITCNLYPNMASSTMQFGRWYCVETHLSQSIAEVWIDGVQTGRNPVVAPSGYNSIQIFRQDSNNLYRYEDDYVLATTRVGCSGTAADTTPPGTPVGFTAK